MRKGFKTFCFEAFLHEQIENPIEINEFDFLTLTYFKSSIYFQL
ncbi:hypothetical protein WPG_2556 [Winogradskyella sp. PG-2]|nr:hypothetical protein WPG_2556 [Winogradskyella sp. PG-2]